MKKMKMISGIKVLNRVQQLQDFNTVCYEKVLYQVKRGYQVMVFVHARNETVRTASVLRDQAKNNGDIPLFLPEQSASYGDALKNVSASDRTYIVLVIVPSYDML